jgi:hypothetical protein
MCFTFFFHHLARALSFSPTPPPPPQTLATMGMPALLSASVGSQSDDGSSSRDASAKSGGGGAAVPAADAPISDAASGVDKDVRLCDGSDGPLKRRDRLRCARRGQRAAALAAVQHRVGVLQYSEGLVPRGMVGQDNGGLKGKHSPLQSFVEEAAVSAVTSAKGLR